MLTFRDLLTLFEYVLGFSYIQGSNHGPDPCDEALLLVLEELDILVESLVDLHRKLQLYFLRQLVQEDDKILRFLAVVVS